MNSIQVIGRMVRDAEIRETKKGKKFATFTVAVNRFNDETDFIDCVVFNENVAGVVEKYTSKGSQIGVTGSLNINVSEKDGHKFKHPQINAMGVDLLDSKSEKKDDEFSNVADEINDNDLPF
ncbi:single-stranded DNA-binding protein [Staphylococcus massiliensis]|uniref:Single-stranded DNA-binding protein n=1 Tax=Staphylococcus massiliensis S46 TaxID=1229783 RepID=K9ASR9_9STAP|nr:single-stranded DNA-binding protein [Staphylococcus massiliensis]EKU50344.1 single-strand binding protein [Staphylococcus massiliensis S46]MCG3401715.1 single-stranded DNA-binding protein [Staphylococcus massiliensis]